jgi:hypothetical protein
MNLCIKPLRITFYVLEIPKVWDDLNFGTPIHNYYLNRTRMTWITQIGGFFWFLAKIRMTHVNPHPILLCALGVLYS